MRKKVDNIKYNRAPNIRNFFKIAKKDDGAPEKENHKMSSQQMSDIEKKAEDE
jgi:hypothetical protein